MSQVVKLTYGPMQENMYLIYDHSNECIVIDPGCSNARERENLAQTIKSLNLTPVRLINTHCHVDHIPGNPFIAANYGIGLEIHENEVEILRHAPDFAAIFQIEMDTQHQWLLISERVMR